MSKIVEINGESLLELDENEKQFIKMFNQCIDIKHYLPKYKLWKDEEITLYNEFLENCNCLEKNKGE